MMQEIPKNKNPRLENKGKHIGGSIAKKKSKTILDGSADFDKRGMTVADYR